MHGIAKQSVGVVGAVFGQFWRLSVLVVLVVMGVLVEVGWCQWLIVNRWGNANLASRKTRAAREGCKAS